MKREVKKRDFITIDDLTKEEILTLLKKAEEFKRRPAKKLLQGSILANCFFEPSTRTRLSFETAALKLGCSVTGFSEIESTSAKKGESLHDTIKIIGNYADIIVIRHPLEGAAKLASLATDKPVINAGDGANQHPTQTLLDLFTIKESQKKLNGLKIALVGDLKYGRTVHSLALACALFDIRLYFLSPEPLTMPDYILHELRKKKAKVSFHHTIEEIIDKIDILYITRLQKERFDEISYEKIKDQYVLKAAMLKKAKKNLKILHPLPRVNEIDREIDSSPYAYYFEQAANGLPVRQALLAMLFNKI
jgi:aspartate carbamoyltransferase catalytic subunit